MELERSAKRLRRLTELEQLDAAQEQMEELKSIKVGVDSEGFQAQKAAFRLLFACFSLIPSPQS